MASRYVPSFLNSRKFWIIATVLLIVGVAFKRGYIYIPKNIDFEVEALKKHLVWIVLVILAILAIAWLIFKPKAWKAVLLIFVILLIGAELGVYYYFSEKNNTKPTDIATADSAPEKSSEEGIIMLEPVQPSITPGSYEDSLLRILESKKKRTDSIASKKNELERTFAELSAKRKLEAQFADSNCIQDSQADQLLTELAKLQARIKKLETEIPPPCEYTEPKKEVVTIKRRTRAKQPREVGVPTQQSFKREVGVPTVQYH